MIDLIVRQDNKIQQIESEPLIRPPADDGLFSGVVELDWFTRTELYRLGLRRKGGNE